MPAAPPKPQRPRIDWSHPLSRGLVGAWPMLEGGGLAARDVTRGRDGTLTNMTTADWVSSPYGPALDFDGANDYADTTLTETFDAYTVSLWINPDDWTPSNTYSNIVSKGSLFHVGNCEMAVGIRTHTAAYAQYRAFFLSTTESGSRKVSEISQINGHFSVPASTLYPAGAWTHIVAIWSSGYQAVFLNGEKVFEGSNAAPVGTSTRTFKIGGPHSVISTDDYFDGQVADVRLWSRVLQDSEVVSLYGSPWEQYVVDVRGMYYGLPLPRPPISLKGTSTGRVAVEEKPRLPQVDWSHPFSRGLVGAWPFHEGGGDTVQDASGQGNAGTISGATHSGGQLGTKLTFTKVGGQDVDFGTNPRLDIAGNITLACWVRVASASNQVFVAKSNPSSVAPWHNFIIHTNTAGKLSFAASVNNTYTYVGDPNVLPTGRWVFCAGTYDGSALKLYLDGVPVKETAASGSITAKAWPMKFANVAYQVPGAAFKNLDGDIADVRIWSRALSASAIRELYVSPWEQYRRPLAYARYARAPSAAAASIFVATQPSGAVSGSPFTTQPVVHLLDAGGSIVAGDSTSTVTATVSAGAVLLGTTTVTVVAGVATFTDLQVDEQVAFTITFSTSAGAFTIEATEVTELAIPTIKPAATISVVGTTVTVTQSNAADAGVTRKLERRTMGSTGAFTVVATDTSPAIGNTLVDSSVPVGVYEYEVADYSTGGSRTFTGQRWGGVVIQASTWDTILAVVRAQLEAQGIASTDIYDGSAPAANYADQTYILRPGEEAVVARANGDLVLRNYPVEIEFLAVALEEDHDDKMQMVRDAHDTITEIFDGATPSDLPSLSALERSLVEIVEKSNLASDEITDLVRSRLLVTFGMWETR